MIEAYHQGKYPQAIEPGKRALKIHQQVLGDHPDTATSLNNLAALYRSMGDYARAEPLYQQALAIMKTVLGENHPYTATSLNNLAVMYYSMGDYARAEPLYQQASEIWKTALGENHPDYALSLNNLAELYRSMGDYTRAEPLYQQALAIDKIALGENHPGYATSLNNLALMYYSMGDYARAEPLFQQALAIDKIDLGENHPDYATNLNNLATLYKSIGDYARAEPLIQQALAILKTALGENHPHYAQSLNNLAGLYSMGDYARAEPLFQQALAILKTALGENHPHYAQSLNNLAGLYYSMGDYARAEPLLKNASEIWKTALGENHPDYAGSLNNLAVLYYSMGDYARAEPLIQQTLLIRQKKLGSSHPNTAIVLMNYAHLLQKQSQPLAAIFFAKRAINTLQSSRQQNIALSKELKKSFIQSKEDKYRTLANWLVNASRLPEAEQVLALLKEKEVFHFLRRDRSRSANFSHNITCTPQEQNWCERYQQISTQLATMGMEHAKLEEKGSNRRTPPEQARFEQLEKDLDIADTAYYALIEDLKQAFSQQAKQQKRLTMAQIDDMPDNFQETLRILSEELNGQVVALYYWLTENRLNIILTTEHARLARVVELNTQELRYKIMAYRQKLLNQQDVSTESQDLYQQIIQPIAADLKKVKANFLMLSLDDVLRYLPIAALHDGKHYFIEQYGLSVYTAATGTGFHLQTPPKTHWKMAGLGVSQGAKAVENKGEQFDFSPLPSAAQELQDIIRENKQDKGILPGKVLLNEAFTLQSLRDTLGQKQHQVLHLATHFKLRPGNESYSFLLLGNGKTLNLSELNQRRYRFRGIDLLTLSACNTAMGTVKAKADGSEIESFGTIAQKKGAKAVLATLWQVNDNSTSALMQHFYQLREQEKVSKLNNHPLKTGGLESLAAESRDTGRIAPFYGSVLKLSFGLGSK
ncbi:tetratricopeptide repeat protein [Candidatus Parabeggiatoa sp. HSG14]|uniref:CHAT domain-containing protein n=1 Tax=Candidatus Parabeggiatoa sp. HSG14 TaxID=3055593 RepID=UPI0025A6C1D7|nr:tetratricopeptide repeat protein [Thiotrichales bacterium HSG14]